MAYKIAYHPLVIKEDINCLPANMRDRIREAIEQRILRDPLQAGKPLRQSLKGHRKMRVGDYRIIYRLEQNLVIILKIGHRKDVYEKVWKRIN